MGRPRWIGREEDQRPERERVVNIDRVIQFASSITTTMDFIRGFQDDSPTGSEGTCNEPWPRQCGQTPDPIDEPIWRIKNVGLTPFTLMVLYLIPFLVASARGLDMPVAFLLAKVVLGWTVIGWFALLYAASLQSSEATGNERRS